MLELSTVRNKTEPIKPFYQRIIIYLFIKIRLKNPKEIHDFIIFRNN